MNAIDAQHIVIVSPYATVTPHFETELELAQLHLDLGDRVTLLSCLGELKTCDFNAESDPQRCEECRLRRIHGFQQLDGPNTQLNFDQIADGIETTSSIPTPQTVDELKALKLKSFDWGFACLSSLVSLCRDPEPDLDEHREQLNRLLSSSRAAFLKFESFLKEQEPDLVYVFNGRFANMRAIFRACLANRTPCKIHERGCDTGHYQLFENRLPHDIAYIESRMSTAWNEAEGNPDRQSIAEQWYKDRVNRVEKNWHSFVKEQKAGLLPADWGTGSKNYVLFTSSEDEFVAIGDCWRNELFSNQLEGIRVVSEILATTQSDARLFVRVHPNLRDVKNRQTQELLNFSAGNTSILSPDDPVDSYTLMQAADTVLTFGSSVGIEAAFWQKPSLLLGPSFYQNLGSTHRPGDQEELREMLSSELPPLDRTGPLIYGYWFQTHGIGFDHFEADGLFSGRFKGEVIYAKRPESIGRKLEKQLRQIRNRLIRRNSRRAG